MDAGLPQLDGHIREPLPEGGIDPGKHICAALRRQADGQAVSAALDLVLQAVVGILPDEQDLPGGLQIDLTGFGGLPSAAGADEQRSMQLVFQPEDLLGKAEGVMKSRSAAFVRLFSSAMATTYSNSFRFIKHPSGVLRCSCRAVSAKSARYDTIIHDFGRSVQKKEENCLGI